jgi:hypothetical protein
MGGACAHRMSSESLIASKMDPVAADWEETQTHRELADDSGRVQKMTRKILKRATSDCQ